MSTFKEKFIISLGSSLLFILVSLSTNKLCPTHIGLLVNTLTFFILTYLTMLNSKIDRMTKLKHSLYGTLIYYFIASPAMYSFISSILGRQFASTNGCPTIVGILLHSIIYCITLIAVMYLPC